jgi:DNA-binding transcriptional MerR regulator
MEEYSVGELAKLSGVSARTLRYYDECGLLPSRRNNSNGYRVYGQEETDRLQQILFYRELGIGVDEIIQILSDTDFEPFAALAAHLDALKSKRRRLDILIRNVEKSIKAMKGEILMGNDEKFEGFKQRLVADNEQKFGAETRAAYGDEAVDRSNAKLSGMTKEQYAQLERLTEELNIALIAAFEQGDPEGAAAHKACELHKDWLCTYWEDGIYSKEAHLCMAQTYISDERFKAYYDNIAPGMAVFLHDAIEAYTALP